MQKLAPACDVLQHLAMASEFPRGTIVLPSAGYKTYIIGAERAYFRDGYHFFLRTSWALSLLLLVAAFLALNVCFAMVYTLVGGIEGAHSGSFADSLFFSVQTMGTIGYGVMHPVSTAAHVAVMAESVVGIIVTALATGLVFAKFARTTARVAFSKHAVICQHDGKPTLMFRVGNQRSNLILEAGARVALSRTERHANGNPFYRLYDLPLVRERSQAVSRGWTIMHVLDDKSMLFGATVESMEQQELELMVSVVGTDDTSMQTVHARHTYAWQDIRVGMRLVDTITEAPSGDMVVDLRKFHDIEPDHIISG
ncbi:MAG TPA: ion channel [Kofleriaceae bacterium]|nr:ion channel [Kofleriaceae bacterium]